MGDWESAESLRRDSGPTRFTSFNALALLRYASALDLGTMKTRPGISPMTHAAQARDLARRMSLEGDGQPLPVYTPEDIELVGAAGEWVCRQAKLDLEKPRILQARGDPRARLQLGLALLAIRDRLQQRLR